MILIHGQLDQHVVWQVVGAELRWGHRVTNRCVQKVDDVPLSPSGALRS